MSRAVNLRFADGISHFDIVIADRRKAIQVRMEGVRLPMPGEHNVQNALAAVTVARELGIGEDVIRSALDKFGGRRPPLHPRRRMARRRDHRRLRPQSVQDRRRAEGGAPGLCRPP